MSLKNKNIEDAFPLSPMQQGMLFHSIYAPNSGVYVEQMCFELHGSLNVSAFIQAWQQVIIRHPVLRIACVWENLEKPLQVVVRQVKLPWQELDWREISPFEQQQSLEAFLQKERQNGFVLSQAPLMRFTLIRLADKIYHFCWSHHHLLLDGWSGAIASVEVIAYYKAFSIGENLYLSLPRPYRDYIAWLQEQDISQAEVFWQKTLAGFTSPIQLGINSVTGQEQSYRKQELKLSSATTAAVNLFVKQHQLTLNTLVQAAWTLLLSRYSGEQDIVFGAIVSGRPPGLVNAESMIGLFINTLPVRVQVSPKQELLPWLQQILAQQVEARQYEYTPLVDIQKWSEIPSGLPLFESILVFENYPVDAGLKKLDLNVEIKNYQGFEKTNYPLTLSIIPGNELLFKIAYEESDRFDVVSINRMLGHLQTLLESMVANPYQRLEELSLLTRAERQQLLVWNETQAEYPQEKCIHELFESQVEATPDAIAVVFEDKELTYRELNAKANQLACYLRKLGVKPEVLVGICLERSSEGAASLTLDAIVGLLGILKAGGAYVPLDPNYPQERLAFMLQDSQVSILLTHEQLVEKLPQHDAKVVCLDNCNVIAQQSQNNPLNISEPDNLAYVIYTSGSTGKPKGVFGLHKGAINRFHWMWQNYPFGEKEICCQKTSLNFVDSVWEIFGTLLQGVTTVIIPDKIVQDPHQLVATLARNNVTRLVLVPSFLRVLLNTYDILQLQLPKLKLWTSSGEPLPIDLVLQFRQSLPDSTLLNLYGSSEVSADVTCYSLTPETPVCERILIGRAIANTQIYILDASRQPVPVGVPGEIYVGGEQLARGYLNSPELTAEKFIPNLFEKAEGSRLYKTGDLARYLPNGEIEYIGRIDHQVKVRGFRIELGEIEAAISQHPAVRETVVIVRSDEADSQSLVAYVVPQTEQTLTISELRRFLESKLPNYMMPMVVMLEAMPLTPNGKINRQALPLPDLTQLILESNFVVPATQIEEILAGIWADVLGIEKVGIHNNFFELGGHSLLATRVISKVRQVFQVEIPLRRLFEEPTVARLAKDIERATKAGLKLETPPIERISRLEELPLSFAQQRLWFLTQLEPNNPFYNISAAVRLEGQLNLAALENSFNEILHRHEALRTNFKAVEGRPVAVISSETPLFLPVLDLKELPFAEKEAEVRQQALVEAQQPFDLECDPLLRVKLLCLEEQKHVVLLTMHHIAADGWSINVLVREVAAFYQAFSSGQASLRSRSVSQTDATRTPFLELPIQYADFAAWQRNSLQKEVLKSQLSFWQQQLDGAPAILELPTDHPRPAIQTFSGATYSFNLSQELSFALKSLSQKEGSTLFMTLLAAFKILLHRYTQSEDIIVGSPIANRNRAEIEGLIGFFVNTLVLRTDLSVNSSFRELLRRVRSSTLSAYAHQDLPFEQLVENLQPQRDLSYTPLFQVMFVFQNAPMSPLELPGLTLSPIDSESQTAKFDLTLEMLETSQGLVGTLEYNSDLFEQSTISRMAGHLQILLLSIVANPDEQLSNLPILTQTEQQMHLEWNDTQTDYQHNQCIHHLFEKQVEQTPDAVAVVFENQSLTYSQLNARANKIAHYLRSLGVEPEVLVGICIERSLFLLIGILGILKAGGAYVPLDPSYPPERLALILEDAQMPVLLTQQHLLEIMPQHQAKVVCLDTEWHQQSEENLLTQVNSSNLAYIIYTSGSTGKPKGVAIEHRSTVAMLDWAKKIFTPEATKGVLASTSICFDLSVFEMFVPLSCGGKVILIENALHLSNLSTWGVTLINTVPSAIAQLLRTNAIPTSVNTINIAGEPLSKKLVQQLYQQDNIQQIFNLYGPSEDTTYSTFALIEKNANSIPPIGRPISNTQIYLLDKNLQPVPVGVPGELYIGGAGLARGYLNQPEITAAKFIPNLYSNQAGERLYKTGDLARYLPNGEIEYIGRIDHQVKIRGFRIELGEIEAAISQHPAVRETVVIVTSDEADSQRIIAYVVPQTKQTLTTTELRRFLESKLPNYMLPAAFVILEALPLTPNGKVNRKALPALDTARPELSAVYQLPQTKIEQTIANIWQEFIQVEDVGIHDNFFELGGHSLLLVQVHSKLQKIFQRDFALVEMFQYPTISQLARYLGQDKCEETIIIPDSHRLENRTASVQRRKQTRQEYRTARKQKGVSD